jgi:leucyl-tRNA synthetase
MTYNPKNNQKKWQEKWQESKIFEVDPSKSEKFFMTVPYPYISGSLHIGQARVVTEADVYARFQRMIGKNVLYPLAFHISGTPVLGISLAIKNKDEKKIELYKGYIKAYVDDDKEVEKILNSFQDPEKIVEFFIPKMEQEFKTLGLSVDWRRSYTSGDIEHQALVEWQFKKYKDLNYLVQGKYPILFSKTLNSAVGEDDIQDGDTNSVEIQEFTLIKFKFEDKYLIAGTLRPETIFGQTNMWINPDVEYKIAKVNGETWIVSKECLEKIKFQEREIKEINSIKGKEMIGKTCFAPFIEREIPIFPSSHCDPKIGTGIVTSVPSDAPFDYLALKELQDSKKLCEKYNLNYEDVKNIKLIPIIKSEGYGDFPAVEICNKMGIKDLSQNDKITEATQKIYKQGFHTGVMKDDCGKYSGMPVTESKERMRKELLDNKKGEIFYETSRLSHSRDGGEVIVAILDGQWFLNFNAKGWKEKANKCLEGIDIWPNKYRKQFEDVFDWLDKRPCARKRGLGTKLPFDKEWVIESLSDSTLYMVLYPIMTHIRDNNIKKEQLTEEFFDYIITSKGDVKTVSKKTNLSIELLEKIHSEWEYWYTFDQRHTFTAHLSNHLSFMIFAHAGLLEEKYWPKRISFHGMIISEGEKMSKSKGNVITLMEINEKVGADAFRAFMCNSTSVESQFNWDSDKVGTMKKHLNSFYSVLSEIQNNKENTKNYKKYASYCSKTERTIRDLKKYIEVMNLREYSNMVLYKMFNDYKKIMSELNSEEDKKSINNYIVDRWIIMLTPLVPHLAEELWSLDKSNEDFVSTQSWPEANIDLINDDAEYEESFLENLKEDLNTLMKIAKIKTIKKIKIFVASNWKNELIELLKSEMEKTRDFGELFKVIVQTGLKRYGQEIQKIVPYLLKNPSKMPVIIKTQEEETEIIKRSSNLLKKLYDCKIEIIKEEDSKESKAKQAMPGKVGILIE